MSYNLRHNHVGTIWASRFKSVLLSPDYKTLMAVGAYIDLNPVRAEIVGEPGEYRWSGYGTALRNNVLSCKGLCILVETAYGRHDVPLELALEVYHSAIEGFIETLAPESTEISSELPEVGGDKPEMSKNVQKPKRLVCLLLRRWKRIS